MIVHLSQSNRTLKTGYLLIKVERIRAVSGIEALQYETELYFVFLYFLFLAITISLHRSRSLFLHRI